MVDLLLMTNFTNEGFNRVLATLKERNIPGLPNTTGVSAAISLLKTSDREMGEGTVGELAKYVLTVSLMYSRLREDGYLEGILSKDTDDIAKPSLARYQQAVPFDSEQHYSIELLLKGDNLEDY
jgi:hypothetical protein